LIQNKILFSKSHLEHILEHAVVDLEDGVLGGQVERESAFQGELEAAVSKVNDGRFRVVHAHRNSGAFVVIDGESLLRTSICGLENELKFSRSLNLDVGRLVLVGVCVPAHNYRLFPGGYQTKEIHK